MGPMKGTWWHRAARNPELRRTKVYEQRMLKNWTLGQLSQKTGIATAQLSKYETAQMTPRVDRAAILARAFGVTIEALFADII